MSITSAESKTAQGARIGNLITPTSPFYTL
jgi:hypothetical protein